MLSVSYESAYVFMQPNLDGRQFSGVQTQWWRIWNVVVPVLRFWLACEPDNRGALFPFVAEAKAIFVLQRF